MYDMDAHVFDDYPGRCSTERHPAMKAWFSAPDPFAWYVGLTEKEFTEFNRATNAEFLDLLADDLAQAAPDKGMVVDGWITNPSLLAQVVPVGQIVCLATSESLSARAWEESADRRSMKEMVFQLPNPEEAWQRFLHFDAVMSRTILRECRESGIGILMRTEQTPLSDSVEQVVACLGIVT
jgi:hypothetical protein